MLKIRVDKMIEIEKEGEIKNKSIGSFEHIIFKDDAKEIELVKALLETIINTL